MEADSRQHRRTASSGSRLSVAAIAPLGMEDSPRKRRNLTPPRSQAVAVPNSQASPASGPPHLSRKLLSLDNTKIFDDATVTAGYESVPLIEINTLPRGGISFETKSVGRVQVRL
jgi:hypothetical protein